CSAAGMRIVGTRRSLSNEVPPGFSRVLGPDGIYELLGESRFVAICCPWTRVTDKLIGRRAFEAMQPDSVLVNVARGEISNEAALIQSLDAGKMRSVALDVYTGEFEQAPNMRLWQDSRVIITPHVSGSSDSPQHRSIELFCDNLRAYLSGDPLLNVIDWE